MKKRMELMVRLVDGGHLYWDASIVVDPLTVEEVAAMMPLPKVVEERMSADVRKTLHELVRAKFQEAADQLFDRALQRIR